MSDGTKPNVNNVSSTKGVAAGYFFVAPVGTKLPKTIAESLDPAFKQLGFISEDGYAETIETDSEDFQDMNGTLMDSTLTSRVESATFTMAEIKADTLKLMYGSKNVTDENGLITVKHVGTPDDVWCAVLELLLKNGRRWRKVVPMAKVDEVGDLTLAASELAGREVTWKYIADDNGSTCYDYYESTETTATGA